MEKISEETKLIQKNLLELLKEFDCVCKDHNIKYSLHAGTLLGAIREKGFIPWDDDADITMMRDEYNKLLSILVNDEDAPIMIIDSYMTAPRIVKKNNKDSTLSCIDILLYDNISENKLAQKVKLLIILVFQAMCRDKNTIKLVSANHRRLHIFLFKLVYLIGKPFPHNTKIRLYNTFCCKCFNGSGKYIHRSNDRFPDVGIILPKDCMKNYCYISFEDTKLMSTEDYHIILCTSYGEDYLIPRRDMVNGIRHQGFRKELANHLKKK